MSHFGKTVELTAGKSYKVKLEYRRISGAYFAVLGGMNGIQMSWASLAASDDLSK